DVLRLSKIGVDKQYSGSLDFKNMCLKRTGYGFAKDQIIVDPDATDATFYLNFDWPQYNSAKQLSPVSAQRAFKIQDSLELLDRTAFRPGNSFESLCGIP